ncbi:MAG: hypothetical protein AAB626_01440 [Patescibacteria group bacterium]
MAKLRLTEETKKILKLARSEGIHIRIIERTFNNFFQLEKRDYYAYACSTKDMMDCLREFDKKILFSALTKAEYIRHCLNDLSVRVIRNSQEEACREALGKFKNRKVKIIRGVLDPFWESGTEGMIWSIDNGKDKKGYDGLYCIHTGDHLTIYGEKGEIIFKGKIFQDTMAGWTEYPRNPGNGQPLALGCWIHWTQIGWKPDDWARLFLRGKKPALRAELIQKRDDRPV